MPPAGLARSGTTIIPAKPGGGGPPGPPAALDNGVRYAYTGGYVCAQPRAELFGHIDAANVNLKGFTGEFYRRTCLARLDLVLETLL